MVLTGVTLPVSARPYTVTELFPKLVTKIWLFTVSTAMPYELLKPVLAPVDITHRCDIACVCNSIYCNGADIVSHKDLVIYRVYG